MTYCPSVFGGELEMNQIPHPSLHNGDIRVIGSEVYEQDVPGQGNSLQLSLD